MVNLRHAAQQYDYLIIGAGPAGLQLGHYLERLNRDYLVLEAGNAAGAFFEHFPRHRTLLSINKAHTGCSDPETNLRWDWNSLLSEDGEMLFTSCSRDYFPDAGDLQRYLEAYAARYALSISYGRRVEKVAKRNELFFVTCASGESYCCRRLIVATGLSKSYIPDIPGIELGEHYVDFSIDSAEFVDQRVLIIGKGNSAFETADNLIPTTTSIQLASPHPVKLAWKTHYVGNLRACNNNLLDTYQLKSQNTLLDAHIDKIEKKNGEIQVSITYTHAKGEKRVIPFDRVLICTGFRFDASIFDQSCRPATALGGKLPDLDSSWQSANVEGLYFAGTLMQARDYQKTMSGFIHGFRHNIQALSRIFAWRYENEPWPCEELPAVPVSLTEHVIQRLNSSAAMFLQPGFIGDVIVVREGAERIFYYRDVPIDYLHDSQLKENGLCYSVTLEYGDFSNFPDPFNIDRDPDPGVAHETAYLHPIIRCYDRGRLVLERHVPEDLENVYSGPQYVDILSEFFAEQLAGRAAQSVV